jgi:hypothetical protein
MIASISPTNGLIRPQSFPRHPPKGQPVPVRYHSPSLQSIYNANPIILLIRGASNPTRSSCQRTRSAPSQPQPHAKHQQGQELVRSVFRGPLLPLPFPATSPAHQLSYRNLLLFLHQSFPTRSDRPWLNLPARTAQTFSPNLSLTPPSWQC